MPTSSQEVEAVLSALPCVRQVACGLAKHPATGADHLVAWVSGAQINRQDLIAACQGMLPEYEVPTVVVCLSELPLLPSGAHTSRNAARLARS
jgi:acyl-CoA synthetase (AMP-forming)/AMP-acid ligase II